MPETPAVPRARRSVADHLVGLGLSLAAVFVVAGIVHIVSILLIPMLAPNDAFARVSALAPPGTLTLLPPAGPASPVPFRDPAVAVALCRYDLRTGPLRVTASIDEQIMLAVSFHSRRGRPFYGLTDRSGNEGKIDLVVMTAEQIAKLDTEDEDPLREVRIEAPEPEGFVEFDALARTGGPERAADVLRSAQCKV